MLASRTGRGQGRPRLRKTIQAAALGRVTGIARSDTTANASAATPHRKRRCAGKHQRRRQSDYRELHCQFDPEGVAGGRYPPLFFRPWLVVTPKLFIPRPL
jgi:hypothetical protein